MRRIADFAPFCLVFFSLLLVGSCAGPGGSDYKKLEGSAFGTTYHITLKDPQGLIQVKQLDSLFDKFNQSLNTYMPESKISRINAGDSTVVLDPLLGEIVNKSGRVYSETEGAFDPTIGVLVNAWGFGPGEAIPNMDQAKVDSLMQYVGFSKIRFERGRLIKPHPNSYLDFNANAKGLGVDVIGRFFESKNIKDYLIEIGGEIRARGRNEKGNLWSVAIEEPNFDGSRSIETIVMLDNESMATSGNYRKFRIDSVTGEKFVHTIDTKTGFPSKSNLLSVTVIGNFDCADADGYATGFMAWGYGRTRVFLEKRKRMKAYLIYADKNGDIQSFVTDNLDLYDPK